MNINYLTKTIKENVEWLETTEGNEVQCISIENLEIILSVFLGKNINLNVDEEDNEEKEQKSRFTQLEMFNNELGKV